MSHSPPAGTPGRDFAPRFAADSGPRPRPIVLAFAASDPTGGAGLQADLLTIAALGCHPLSAVTALTVQDTSGVERIMAVHRDWVVDQAQCVLAEMRVDAFKLGVLGSAENVEAVAAVLAQHPDVPMVLDPVLASERGDSLANDRMIEALLELIVPRATVMTPNSLEARRLGGADDLAECAHRLAQRGSGHVLITGTHEPGDEVRNTLYGDTGVVREDRWARLPGSYHGSGCTLASALAAALAHGMKVADAAHAAQAFTWQALKAGFRPGKGQFLPDRFWARHAEGEE
jgi:hydroxymethylpyrimidine/phosphomethylpyrimidine kinase